MVCKVLSFQLNFDDSKRKGNNQKYDYLLKDLLFCGCCKNKMNGRTNKKNHISLYSCHSNINKWRDGRYSKCENFKSINVEITDILVWSKVVETLQKSELRLI